MLKDVKFTESFYPLNLIAMQKLLAFFQQKISMYLPYFKIETLTSH